MSAAIRVPRSPICWTSWWKPRTCLPSLACMSRPAQRGRRRGHAGRLDQLSAARRGDLEIDRRLYLDRLAAVREADDKAAAGGRLLAATARQLALRMSYEDVIRVAQAKIDPARFARIMREHGVTPKQIFTVTEFLKPGVDELCSILPTWLAGGVLSVALRFPAFGRAHYGMTVNSRSVSGYLRFVLLASLGPFRRSTYRFRQEQDAIEAWLRLIVEAAAHSGEFAVEIANVPDSSKAMATHIGAAAPITTRLPQV